MAGQFPEDEFDKEMLDFINKEKKKSTVSSTKCHIANVSKWLENKKNISTPLFEIPPEILNRYLCEFFMQLKKKDGTDYEPTTISSFNASIERYLRENMYQACLMSDRAFIRLREVISAKKSQLKKAGLGRKAHAAECIDAKDDELLIAAGELGDSSPRVLQTTLFYLFGKGFGLRGRDEHRSMQFGDVIIERTSSNQEYLLFQERNSKTMDGTKRDDFRPVRPKIFSTGGGQFDPVRLFRLYCKKRPAGALFPSFPMYLTPIPEDRLQKDGPWYYQVPMGKNVLGTLISDACKRAGVQGKKTNHSIRKRTVSDLSAAGVPPEKIVLLTGHKSTASLQHYSKSIDLDEHRLLSNHLSIEKPRHLENITNKSRFPTATASSSTATGADQSSFNINRTLNLNKSSNTKLSSNISRFPTATASPNATVADQPSFTDEPNFDLDLDFGDSDQNQSQVNLSNINNNNSEVQNTLSNTLSHLFSGNSFHNCTFNFILDKK